jgi:ribosomal protein L11 methyltransferase
VPYRIDLIDPPAQALDVLVDFGALDIDAVGGGLAALMPDSASADAVARALGVRDLRVSAVVGRDDDSVWTLGPRPFRVGSLLVVPDGTPAPPDGIVIVESAAFGTGLHLSTALCIEAMEQLFEAAIPDRMLDVGTGSGIVALAALRHGVGRAVGLDIDASALRIARRNARLSGLADRLDLVHGGPESVTGSWPLVVANIRAAELIEMAPLLVTRLASRGRLMLSGIPSAVADDVERIYRRMGMTALAPHARGGWSAPVHSPARCSPPAP